MTAHSSGPVAALTRPGEGGGRPCLSKGTFTRLERPSPPQEKAQSFPRGSRSSRSPKAGQRVKVAETLRDPKGSRARSESRTVAAVRTEGHRHRSTRQAPPCALVRLIAPGRPAQPVQCGCLHPIPQVRKLRPQEMKQQTRSHSWVSTPGSLTPQPVPSAVPSSGSSCRGARDPQPQQLSRDIPAPAPRPGHTPAPPWRWGDRRGPEALLGHRTGPGPAWLLSGSRVLLSAWHLGTLNTHVLSE